MVTSQSPPRYFKSFTAFSRGVFPSTGLVFGEGGVLSKQGLSQDLQKYVDSPPKPITKVVDDLQQLLSIRHSLSVGGMGHFLVRKTFQKILHQFYPTPSRDYL